MQISGLYNLIDDFGLWEHNLELSKAKAGVLYQSMEPERNVDIRQLCRQNEF